MSGGNVDASCVWQILEEMMTTEQRLKRANRKLRTQLKAHQSQAAVQAGSIKYLQDKVHSQQAQLNDKEDRLLPQKQQLLKELSFLVNATSRAVRTTMWSMKPPSKLGW